ncbi:MAG TPA: transcriptional repressor [Kofleriaceae bacterium]|jgi:Fur family ferric uptake transcriptional regulator
MRSKADLEGLRKLLRAGGLRATASRIAVLEHLRTDAVQPRSHAEVAATLSSGPWDPATIYRNLLDLVEVGLARRTDMGDHVWRFEAVSDKHDEGHPHFVCTDCGTVECLPELKLVMPRAKTPRAVRDRKVELHLRGICDQCA